MNHAVLAEGMFESLSSLMSNFKSSIQDTASNGHDLEPIGRAEHLSDID